MRPTAASPVVGIELEAFLLKPDGEGGFQAVHTPGAHVYGSGPLMDPGGVMEAVLAAADRCGIVLESFHSEYDDGQFELTLGKNDALAAADEAFLFKLLAREVAAERGYHLTFIGKPFSDRGGSGLHVNLSLEEDGKNVFGDPGRARAGSRSSPGPRWPGCCTTTGDSPGRWRPR